MTEHAHTIRINDLATINLTIPDEMNLQELDSLLQMTRKMININTVTYDSATRPTGRPPTTPSKPKIKRGERHVWTQKERIFILKTWNKNVTKKINQQTISEALGVTETQVSNQYYDMKRHKKRGKK